ncbi:hypothetical protein N9954_05415 [Maribacter sp.]|nr:hypothetical protein [Maribacter sp.]
MKVTTTLITLAAALFTQLSFGSGKIPIPLGAKQKIIHIMDLPNQKAFQMEDGRYFDVGSHYEIHHMLWLAFSHSEPQLIGYLGNSDEYVVLTPNMLKAIKKTFDNSIEVRAEVSFMDKFGGKVILGIILLLAMYRIYTHYFSKTVELEEVYR